MSIIYQASNIFVIFLQLHSKYIDSATAYTQLRTGWEFTAEPVQQSLNIKCDVERGVTLLDKIAEIFSATCVNKPMKIRENETFLLQDTKRTTHWQYANMTGRMWTKIKGKLLD